MNEYIDCANCAIPQPVFLKIDNNQRKTEDVGFVRHGTLRAKINKLPPVQYYIAIYSI